MTSPWLDVMHTNQHHQRTQSHSLFLVHIIGLLRSKHSLLISSIFCLYRRDIRRAYTYVFVVMSQPYSCVVQSNFTNFVDEPREPIIAK